MVVFKLGKSYLYVLDRNGATSLITSKLMLTSVVCAQYFNGQAFC